MVRLFLFLIFPALELYLLVKVGGMIGALNMVLWVFASAIIGITAVRAQGQEAMFKVRSDLSEGKVPQNTFLDGLLMFLGGVLLILPGLISDAIGLLLLIPFVRRMVSSSLGGYFATRAPQGGRASRIIFFSSGPGGSGLGGFGQRPGAPGSYQTRQPFEPDDREPRQATIIESTAIDITPEEPGKDNDNAPGGKGQA